MAYEFSREDFEATYPEVEALYRAHYAEMGERLSALGQDVSPYDPRLDQYNAAGKGGYLLTFLIRLDGEVVGYSNIYLTNDMHNRDFIATEDTIFVEKTHRNGIGRRFSKYILEVLRELGVKKLTASAMTDLRVEKLWKRMGFKPIATVMTYTFGES